MRYETPGTAFPGPPKTTDAMCTGAYLHCVTSPNPRHGFDALLKKSRSQRSKHGQMSSYGGYTWTIIGADALLLITA